MIRRMPRAGCFAALTHRRPHRILRQRPYRDIPPIDVRTIVTRMFIQRLRGIITDVSARNVREPGRLPCCVDRLRTKRFFVRNEGVTLRGSVVPRAILLPAACLGSLLIDLVLLFSINLPGADTFQQDIHPRLRLQRPGVREHESSRHRARTEPHHAAACTGGLRDGDFPRLFVLEHERTEHRGMLGTRLQRTTLEKHADHGTEGVLQHRRPKHHRGAHAGVGTSDFEDERIRFQRRFEAGTTSHARSAFRDALFRFKQRNSIPGDAAAQCRRGRLLVAGTESVPHSQTRAQRRFA